MGRQSLSKPRADVSAVSQQQLTERGLSSTDELQATLEARGAARQALSELLASPDVPGISKQAARCAFIHEHGRLACQCPGCWLLPAHCVCSHLTHAAPQTQLVMHVHPDERGKGECVVALCSRGAASPAANNTRAWCQQAPTPAASAVPAWRAAGCCCMATRRTTQPWQRCWLMTVSQRRCCGRGLTRWSRARWRTWQRSAAAAASHSLRSMPRGTALLACDAGTRQVGD